MRETGESTQHLAGLVVVAVDSLLAEKHEAGLLVIADFLETLGDGEGLQIAFGLHQDTAVGAEGEGRADLLLGGLGADGNGDDFGGNALLLEANRFFHRDFTEGVDGHFHVGEVDGAAVSLGAHLHVVVNDTFYGDKYLHE